ncbi:S26 family signal peptidase [Streptomyces sp. NPDC087897]|uniref:S26 family signal peptidase n=1 Tax=Streptomyces sp. NPDC087897 TaxID=3365817 RepID=UPI0037FC0C39
MQAFWVTGGIASAVVACLSAALLLRRRFTVVTIEGTSMEPTLSPGDQVVVKRRGIDRIRSGDIVVLLPPRTRNHYESLDGSAWNIKRAAAVPGDPVPAGIPGADGLTEVPAGALVVFGDNPDSIDSRHRGLFSADRMLGVATRRLGGPAL